MKPIKLFEVVQGGKKEIAGPLIRLEGAGKCYPSPSGAVDALKDVSLEIDRGEFVAVVGKSGSGKTTLINLLTGIDTPTSGRIFIGESSVHEMNQEKLSVWRGRNVGVVFQFFQLIPTLTVSENVMLPMDFCGMWPSSERPRRALELLDKVGIVDQADKLPSDLSGGQQQRAAIARALANDPSIIIADEPTGNLDTHTADTIMRKFRELADEGKTVIMVTHERDYQKLFSRTITLVDGRINVGAGGES